MVYEALGTFGGRVQTRRHFNADKMFVESGGEFIDTGHTEIIQLCQELDLELTTLADTRAGKEELYYFNQTFYTETQLLSAFRPLALRILDTVGQLGETPIPTYQKPGNAFAQKLSALSLAGYLAEQKDGVESWVLRLIEQAYVGEYGLEIGEQSVFNLLSLIGVTPQSYQLKGVRSLLSSTLLQARIQSESLFNEAELQKLHGDRTKR